MKKLLGIFLALFMGLSFCGFAIQLKATDITTQKVIGTANFEYPNLPEDDLAFVRSCNDLVKSTFKNQSKNLYFTIENKNIILSLYPSQKEEEKFDFKMTKEFFEYWIELSGSEEKILSETKSYRDDRGRVTRIDSYEAGEIVKSVQFLYENNIVARVLETNRDLEYDSSYDDSGRLVKKILFKNDVLLDQSFIDYLPDQARTLYEISLAKSSLVTSTYKNDSLFDTSTYLLGPGMADKTYEIEDVRLLPEVSKRLEKKSIEYDGQQRIVREVISNDTGMLAFIYEYEGDKTSRKKLRNNELIELSTSSGDDETILYYSRGRAVLKRIFANGVLKSEEKLK